MIDLINLASTVHAYSGGSVGVGLNSIDGDFNTYYGTSGADTATGSGGSFAAGGTVTSTHTFLTPVTIQQIIFKIMTTTSSTSSTDHAAHSQYKAQYQVSGDSSWYDFTGGSGSNGSFSPGTVTLNQTVLNVTAVRAYVSNSGSFHNSDGSHSWDLRIYEIQAYGLTGSGAGYATMF